MLLQNILVRVDGKPAGPARQVADAFARLRIHHLHHHADNMPRRTELSIAPRRAQFVEQLFIQIVLNILILGEFISIRQYPSLVSAFYGYINGLE